MKGEGEAEGENDEWRERMMSGGEEEKWREKGKGGRRGREGENDEWRGSVNPSRLKKHRHTYHKLPTCALPLKLGCRASDTQSMFVTHTASNHGRTY